jgi:hypothetical protein
MKTPRPLNINSSPKRETPLTLHRDRMTLNRRLSESRSGRVSIENLALPSDIRLFRAAQKHTVESPVSNHQLLYPNIIDFRMMTMIKRCKMILVRLQLKLNVFKLDQKRCVFGIRLLIHLSLHVQEKYSFVSFVSNVFDLQPSYDVIRYVSMTTMLDKVDYLI